jgi:hypothetical protein
LNPWPLESLAPAEKIYAAFDGSQNTKNLPGLCLELISEQIKVWPDLRQGYESLKNIRVREVLCNGFSVRIQHNPGRIRSTTADVGDNHINNRSCFLCLNNLPEAQKGILYRNAYLILCNPAPVFSSHLTISCLDHRPQAIVDHINTFLQLTGDFGDRRTVLYNGPKCGASAPDHLHFQAIPSGLMPIEKETLEEGNLIRITKADNVRISCAKGLGRETIILEGDDPLAVANVFNGILAALKEVLYAEEEPMINIAGFYDNGKWRLLIFPRTKHRPEAFFREGEDRVLVSPAVIEMCGVIIAPVGKDFEKLDASTLDGIYREVSLKTDIVERVIASPFLT